MSAAQARRCRGAHLLNDLRVLIRRYRIKAAFNTSSDNGFELRVRHTLRNWGDGGLDLARHQACYHPHVADRIGDRRGHQRRPAPDLPARVDIGEKLFTQLVA